MKIIYPKDAINRRLYKGLIIVKTVIYRLCCLTQQYCYGTNPNPKASVANLVVRSLYMSAETLCNARF
nr:hypothetical protein [Nostoc sp. ChiSLP03a]MDZ8210242.1 hypothetical protein [Nostoc sp. ChiSLP03a]